MYTDEEQIEFNWNIGGVKLSFYSIEDEFFEYSIEFNLKVYF